MLWQYLDSDDDIMQKTMDEQIGWMNKWMDEQIGWMKLKLKPTLRNSPLLAHASISHWLVRIKSLYFRGVHIENSKKEIDYTS